MGGSSPSLRAAGTGQLLDTPHTPPPLIARSLTRSFVIPQASDPAGWGLPWPIRNQRRACALISGTSWNLRRGAPFRRWRPQSWAPWGRRRPCRRASQPGAALPGPEGWLGASLQKQPPRPRMGGAQPFRQGRPPLRPLCPALSHTAEPGVGSDPDSAPPAEAGLLGGRQRGRKRGLWVIWEEQSRGEHRLGVLDLPRAREPVWGPHAPTCGMEEPRLPGRGQGGERPAWRARSPAREPLS